ncbi:MAG: hypothetical protein K2R98_31520 [Gemmataceae bacterium]|nr:hypothetical protein [Gemmataceae bacterium]
MLFEGRANLVTDADIRGHVSVDDNLAACPDKTLVLNPSLGAKKAEFCLVDLQRRINSHDIVLRIETHTRLHLNRAVFKPNFLRNSIGAKRRFKGQRAALGNDDGRTRSTSESDWSQDKSLGGSPAVNSDGKIAWTGNRARPHDKTFCDKQISIECNRPGVRRFEGKFGDGDTLVVYCGVLPRECWSTVKDRRVGGPGHCVLIPI